jgi:hypothetical protein
VKIGVKYPGENVLKAMYSTLFLLCFQCALLLAAVGLVCIFDGVSIVTSYRLLCCVCVTLLDTSVAGLLARRHYLEGPATGHLGSSFFAFPVSVYKRMLRFPRLKLLLHASNAALLT